MRDSTPLFDGSSPRKRPRVEGEDSEFSDTLSSSPRNSPQADNRDGQHQGNMRDETYYMSDGSCILLVENTLLNVHKTMLSRDSSSFGTMFTLPQGDMQVEGTSDDNPIILVGDTIGEFRNFLWALYALCGGRYYVVMNGLTTLHSMMILHVGSSYRPPELMIVHTAQADLPKLIDIARVSNKYSFKSLETWALDAIQEYVNRQPSPILTQPKWNSTPIIAGTQVNPAVDFKPSSVQIRRLIRLAHMCSHERLLNTMINLIKQLMTTSIQYAYLAMCLSDELDLRVLKGAAYLEVMQKTRVIARDFVDVDVDQDIDGNIEDESEGLEVVIDASGRLVVSSIQKLRLLSGYHGLSRAWESMRTAPPSFDHAPSCGATWHQHGCTQSWLEFWKEKTRGEGILALGLADVLGRLKAIQKEFDKWGSATYMHHDCRMSAKRVINDKIIQVEKSLPDYFSEAGD